MAQETFLQSEEDMQRMIERGAWYSGCEESSVATVEADSDTESNYNRNEVRIKHYIVGSTTTYIIVGLS